MYILSIVYLNQKIYPWSNDLIGKLTKLFVVSTIWLYLFPFHNLFWCFHTFLCEDISATFFIPRIERINRLTKKWLQSAAKFGSRMKRLFCSTLHQLVLLSRFTVSSTNSFSFCDSKLGVSVTIAGIQLVLPFCWREFKDWFCACTAGTASVTRFSTKILYLYYTYDPWQVEMWAIYTETVIQRCFVKSCS